MYTAQNLPCRNILCDSLEKNAYHTVIYVDTHLKSPFVNTGILLSTHFYQQVGLLVSRSTSQTSSGSRGYLGLI